MRHICKVVSTSNSHFPGSTTESSKRISSAVGKRLLQAHTFGLKDMLFEWAVKIQIPFITSFGLWFPAVQFHAGNNWNEHCSWIGNNQNLTNCVGIVSKSIHDLHSLRGIPVGGEHISRYACSHETALMLESPVGGDMLAALADTMERTHCETRRRSEQSTVHSAVPWWNARAQSRLVQSTRSAAGDRRTGNKLKRKKGTASAYNSIITMLQEPNFLELNL